MDVNVDHGGHDTWYMVRGHHFMTPQGIYSIKIFVSLCQDFGQFHDPSRVLQRSNFCITFEQEFRSIWLRNSSILLSIWLEFGSKIADFLSILEKDFIDFHWFFMNLLWLFIEFWFGKWMKYFSQILGFYYQIFIDLTLLQHFYFCITFWWFWAIIIKFHCENGVSTQIHYFKCCPTFGWILSGFGQFLVDFHSILEVSTQIHYFYFCPTFWPGFGFKIDFEQIKG